MGRFFNCKGCEKRYPGCHGTCESYKKGNEEWQKARDYIKAEEDFDRYKARSIVAYRERKRRRGWKE